MDEDKKQLMPGKSTRYYLAGGLIVFFTVYYSAVSLMSPARKVASKTKIRIGEKRFNNTSG